MLAGHDAAAWYVCADSMYVLLDLCSVCACVASIAASV